MIALFFDTETTGLEDDAAIVQIAAMLQDVDTGRVLSELSTIVKLPEGKKIGAKSLEVHGITESDTNKYGIWVHQLDSLFSDMIDRSDVVVAHNSKFDMARVSHNLVVSSNKIKPKKVFCTMMGSIEELSIPGKYGGFKYPSLAEAHQHYLGRGFDGAHDAMVDVRACRDVFVEMRKRGLVKL